MLCDIRALLRTGARSEVNGWADLLRELKRPPKFVFVCVLVTGKREGDFRGGRFLGVLGVGGLCISACIRGGIGSVEDWFMCGVVGGLWSAWVSGGEEGVEAEDIEGEGVVVVRACGGAG